MIIAWTNTSWNMECALNRRQAEYEFVTAAYGSQEAWVTTANESDRSGRFDVEAIVHRRLISVGCNDGAVEIEGTVSFVLLLSIPCEYPILKCLQVSAYVDIDRTTTNLLKIANNALNDLLVACRESALLPGEEAIYAVFLRAEEWLIDSWPVFLVSSDQRQQEDQLNRSKRPGPGASVSATSLLPVASPVFMCRTLVYSHHIISKKKRAALKDLAAELLLTGICKIGWPGLLILEGTPLACQSYYNDIRRWNWQHLVLRGEDVTEIPQTGNLTTLELLDAQRKFQGFIEADDMSWVAAQCRQVDLESLFLASMKVNNSSKLSDLCSVTESAAGTSHFVDETEMIHAALLKVDHMNDGKAYRKWLRNTCQSLQVALLIQQYYPNQDFERRPFILVGLVGTKHAISSVLRKWRTGMVDVNSRGQSCRERMITMLVDCTSLNGMEAGVVTFDAWEELSSEQGVNTSREKLDALIFSIGIQAWNDALVLLL